MYLWKFNNTWNSVVVQFLGEGKHEAAQTAVHVQTDASLQSDLPHLPHRIDGPVRIARRRCVDPVHNSIRFDNSKTIFSYLKGTNMMVFTVIALLRAAKST